MMDFIEGAYDVLLATTIIESGIDISNANTIIINDAKIDGQTIDVGDEIGIFDGDLCVGAGIFDGTFNFIITGFVSGIKYWRRSFYNYLL